MLNTEHLLICTHKIYIYEHTKKILVNYLLGINTGQGGMLYAVSSSIHYVAEGSPLSPNILCR